MKSSSSTRNIDKRIDSSNYIRESFENKWTGQLSDDKESMNKEVMNGFSRILNIYSKFTQNETNKSMSEKNVSLDIKEES